MEKQQERCDNSKMNVWIKCQSRKRPGLFYMFNKTTGETKWCSDVKDDDLRSSSANNDKRSASESKLMKPLRTPAQDRLKRLQNSLKKENKEKIARKQLCIKPRKNREKVVIVTKDENGNTKGTNAQEDSSVKTKSVPNKDNITVQKDCQPSTSKSAFLVKLEPNTSSSKEVFRAPTPKISPPKKTTILSPNEGTNDVRPSLADEKVVSKSLEAENNQGPMKDNEAKGTCTTSSISTSASSLGRGIVNTIKAIYKSTFSSYRIAKRQITSKPLKTFTKKPSTHAGQYERQTDEDATMLKDATTSYIALAKQKTDTLSKPKDDVDVKVDALSRTPSQLYATTNNFVIPAYERGCANSRLEHLRLSLRKQAFSTANREENDMSTRLCAPASSSALACVIPASKTVDDQASFGDDVEPMDWAPIDDSIGRTPGMEISRRQSYDRNSELNTIGEYYSAVNENLLRFAVEQKHDATTITGNWLNDFYYFVLDTNVLLKHLTFLEDLSHMKLCDTNGTVLYIPYCVLQELDKLKQFARGDGTKVLAVRAIKYLNTKFAAKVKHLQAQSAVSELEHLIEVTSPDDRIINCCLQVKQHIDYVILMTEDINLRNKAMCNNILVSTKSDLVTKHNG